MDSAMPVPRDAAAAAAAAPSAAAAAEAIDAAGTHIVDVDMDMESNSRLQLTRRTGGTLAAAGSDQAERPGCWVGDWAVDAAGRRTMWHSGTVPLTWVEAQ
jgi:hypothetical protein